MKLPDFVKKNTKSTSCFTTFSIIFGEKFCRNFLEKLQNTSSFFCFLQNTSFFVFFPKKYKIIHFFVFFPGKTATKLPVAVFFPNRPLRDDDDDEEQ